MIDDSRAMHQETLFPSKGLTQEWLVRFSLDTQPQLP